MENSIVKLRAHHIKNLIGYSANHKLSDTEFIYGAEFAEKARNTFNSILSGQTSVILTDGPDDLCEICKNKIGDECASEGDFYSSDNSANFDRKWASRFNLKIGTMYTGLNFLEILGLTPAPEAAAKKD
jgi:hypothetical protein